MQTNWEEDLAALLRDLSAVQDELLSVLAEKHRLLASAAIEPLDELGRRETQIVDRLQACHERRQQLLQQAAEDGRAAGSLRAAAASLPRGARGQLDPQLRAAAARSRLLQHQCLTNWVLTQRTLIHLAQLLEIVATGGRPRPTYGEGAASTGGALVDQAV